MANQDPGRELPQRVRGTARTGPSRSAPSSSPVLSEELRQRIRAAVTAERTGAAATGQDEAQGGEAAGPEPARPGRSANAGPIPQDEITEWLGTTTEPPSGVTSRPEVKPPSGVRSSSGGNPPVAGPYPAGSARPAGQSGGQSGGRRAARLVVVVLVIGVLAVAAVRYFGRSAAGSQAGGTAGRAAAAARGAAAAWVAQQVSRDAKVSCDPAMCAALRTRGFPSGELLVLGSASKVPTSSAVVVETPAVLSLFGSSLATAWAPAVLASFGSGSALVTVRVIAPNGAAAYQTKLSADLADRKTAGAALLNDAQITVPPLASEQLTAGAVDSRLLLALAALAARQPISIVQFGNPGPGPGAGVPLRFVDLAERDRARHMSPAAYVRSVRAYLSTVDPRFRPASMMTVVLAEGQAVLRVEVTAPSPLGVFGAPSTP
jgi:hypothetical protein